MADLFDIVVAKKLASGGGGGVTVEELNVTDNGTYTAPTGKAYSPVKVNVSGGGSSDFSTATVTVTTSAEKSRIWVSAIEEAFPPFVPDATIRPFNNVYPDEPITLTVALYKGHATGFLEEGATATVTGSITRTRTILDIAGDGTIAIS